jgi:hypothetical protein
MSIRRARAVALLALFSAAAAHADFQFGFETGVGHSDNITRVPTAEINETIGIAGVDLIWTEMTQRIEADATVNLDYLEYLENTYDGEVLGTADGTLTLGIVPERFTWDFQDTFGQAQSDPFAPATPETRSNLNYFTTGPDLYLRFGLNAAMRLYVRGSAVRYEEITLDHDRTAAGVSFSRQTAAGEIALNGVTERVDFESEGDVDYDRRGAFVSYTLDSARTDITTELGYTWIKPEGGDSDGGPLVDITISRDISSASILELSVGTQFTDTGDSLRGELVPQVLGGSHITATSDPFENRSASLEWRFQRNRTGFSISAGWNEERYEEETQFDRTRYFYGAYFSRRMSRTLELGLQATMSDDDFENAGFTIEELSAGTSLSWSFGQHVGLRLSLDRFDRKDTRGITEFVENRGFLTIFYRSQGRGGAGVPIP